jgi:hydrogenase maturation protein HypF
VRKRREEKPFALMYPSLELVRAHCVVSDLEARLLLSSESPIVLVRKRQEARGKKQEVRSQKSEGSSLRHPIPTWA